MSRHEGVTCDSCSNGNFRGKRFKCLICYDYDLCATCYENGATTTRHTADHPMQCILTRTDFELYYGGEAFTADQPQSFTCPYCGKMGFTESALQEHVASEHSEASIEVVCPVCAALPGGDPNHVTDDFAAHLTLEHRAPSRDILYDEPGAARHVRRLFHPAVSGSRPRPPRPRATNMHFGGSGGSGLASSSSSSTSGRESMDPIAELLSQLSGVRRAAQQSQPPMQSQLQLLQQQLQLERQQVQQTRERLERLPARRQMAAAAAAAAACSSAATATTASTQESSGSCSTSFLLARANEPSLSEAEQELLERDRADRSLFVQDLILSTLGSAAFRRRPRPISSSTEPADQFASLTLQDSDGNRESREAAAQDCNVIEQDITVQDMELISLDTEGDEDKDS